MPRVQKDTEKTKRLCKRFIMLMDDVLCIKPAEMARRLGYANSTTIHKIKALESFPDVERLQSLADIRTSDGSVPDLHWLITGQGKPLRKQETGTRSRRRRGLELTDPEIAILKQMAANSATHSRETE